MHKIERDMLQAVNLRKTCNLGNTSVRVDAIEGVTVSLHGHDIWRRRTDGVVVFTLAGWNTTTTRSRLRALGVGVRCSSFAPFVGDTEIASDLRYILVDGKPAPVVVGI